MRHEWITVAQMRHRFPTPGKTMTDESIRYGKTCNDGTFESMEEEEDWRTFESRQGRRTNFVGMAACLGILVCIALSPNWFAAGEADYGEVVTPIHKGQWDGTLSGGGNITFEDGDVDDIIMGGALGETVLWTDSSNSFYAEEDRGAYYTLNGNETALTIVSEPEEWLVSDSTGKTICLVTVDGLQLFDTDCDGIADKNETATIISNEEESVDIPTSESASTTASRNTRDGQGEIIIPSSGSSDGDWFNPYEPKWASTAMTLGNGGEEER